MGEERYDRKKREIMRQKRLAKVKKQRMVIFGSSVALIVILILTGTFAWRNYRNKKLIQAQEKKIQKLVGKGYENYFSELGETQTDGTKFGEWVIRTYPEKIKEELPKAIEDGDFTDLEAYKVLGATMHVLKDAYEGNLKTVAEGEKNRIYLGGSGKTWKESTAENKKNKADTVTISVAGDLCLEEDGFVIDKYDELGSLDRCISPEILDITNKADIFYLNHEYTVGERGEALPGKFYTFQAKPERMELLKEMGTDLVSLANNHVYDYGEVGFFDTLSYLDEAKIPYVGGGKNIEEAESAVYFIENGIKIGFVAASNAELTLYTPAATETEPGILDAYDTTQFNRVIADASKECDYLIAYIHWGPEDVNQYATYQTTEGKEFLDSGADIVIGGHPHVLQGMEYINGKPIVYSMGDFWFNHETKYTGLLNLELSYEGLEKLSFTPCLQTGFTTQYISDKDKQREMFDFLENLSPNVQIDDNGVITEIL